LGGKRAAATSRVTKGGAGYFRGKEGKGKYWGRELEKASAELILRGMVSEVQNALVMTVLGERG